MFLRQKCQQQRHMAVTFVLALATLSNATQIEMILISKACKEGAILLTFLPTKLSCVYIGDV
jgi:hypothetical protein